MMLQRLLLLISIVVLLLMNGSHLLFAAEIRNLKTGQQGNHPFALYDLVGKPGEMEAEVQVVIEVGGEKYTSDKLTLRGDVGKGVKAGVGKRITWELLKDMPAGFDGEITWDIEVAGSASVGLMTAASGFTDPNTGMIFVPVQGGCFKMGDIAGNGDEDERPVHEVCVDGFSIGKFEVTQGQWQSIMGTNPSTFRQCGKNCPVEGVAWNDVQKFITKLNLRSDKNYRLPTEAEWEYAASSGGRRERYSGGDQANALAWFEANAGGRTRPVGQKKTNGLGIHDMSGNVAEWVDDIKGDYQAASQKNPTGSDSGVNRVLRGGGWNDLQRNLRVTSRSELTPSVRTNTIGFRLVLPATVSQ